MLLANPYSSNTFAILGHNCVLRNYSFADTSKTHVRISPIRRNSAPNIRPSSKASSSAVLIYSRQPEADFMNFSDAV